MTQKICMLGNSDLFIFCDQPYSPADLSVPYSHMYTKQPFCLTRIIIVFIVTHNTVGMVMGQ